MAESHGLDVFPTPALREIDVGEWSGLTSIEIQERFPAEGAPQTAPEGDGWECGETHAAMSERIPRRDLRASPASIPRGTSSAWLPRRDVIRALLAHAAGTELGEYRRTQRGNR